MCRCPAVPSVGAVVGNFYVNTGVREITPSNTQSMIPQQYIENNVVVTSSKRLLSE